MNADELAVILDELGRRLGPAGEYAFRLAVQRVVIAGVLNVVLGLILAIGCLIAGVAVWRYATAPGQDRYSDRPFGGFLAGGAFLFIGLVGLIFVYSGALALLTPEYAALRDILAAVSGLR